MGVCWHTRPASVPPGDGVSKWARLTEPQARQGKCWLHLLLALPLKQEGAPSSLPFSPFPGPMPAHRQEADCQQEHFGTVSSWDRMSPPPPAAKAPLHSHMSHPFLRERVSQQPVLHFVGMCWMPMQQAAPASQLPRRAGDVQIPRFQDVPMPGGISS